MEPHWLCITAVPPLGAATLGDCWGQLQILSSAPELKELKRFCSFMRQENFPNPRRKQQHDWPRAAAAAEVTGAPGKAQQGQGSLGRSCPKDAKGGAEQEEKQIYTWITGFYSRCQQVKCQHWNINNSHLMSPLVVRGLLQCSGMLSLFISMPFLSRAQTNFPKCCRSVAGTHVNILPLHWLQWNSDYTQ